MRFVMTLCLALALSATAAAAESQDFSKYMIDAELNPERIYTAYSGVVSGLVRSSEKRGGEDGQLNALSQRLGVTEEDAKRLVRFGKRYDELVARDNKSSSAEKARRAYCRTFNRTGEIDIVALEGTNAADANKRHTRDRKLYQSLLGDLSDEGKASMEALMSRSRPTRRPKDVDWIAFARDLPEQTNEMLKDRCKDA